MPSAIFKPLLAANLTTWDKLKQIPSQTWINLLICILAVVVIVRLWRALKKFNDFAPWFAAALAGSFIGFYWVYERTEPKFLTPVVDRLVFFLPTKDKHQKDLEKIRQNSEAVRQ